MAAVSAPGVIPDVTWVDETRRFAENGEMLGLAPRQAAVFRAGAGPSPSLLAEAFGLLRRALGARPLPQQGLLIAKRLYDEARRARRSGAGAGA